MARALIFWTVVAAMTGCADDSQGPAHAAQAPSQTERACPTGAIGAFPLRVEPNRRHLVDSKGRPFLITGDAAWSLIAQLREADIDRYLDDRKLRRFNTILVNLLEARYASRAPANIYGERPFTRDGDLTTPNEAYFRRADSVIRKAADRGILVLLVPAYFGYDDDGWYHTLVTNGERKVELYGRYLGTRYAGCTNVVWVIGGDRTPRSTASGDALARGILSAAPASIFTAHADSEAPVDAIWGASTWLSLNTLFTYEDVWPRALRLYRGSAKPFFLIESAYENDGWHVQTPTRMRTQAYQAVLAGATGQVFGNNPLWHFDGPGCCSADHFPTTWQEALGLEGSRSMTVLASVFARFPWHTLVPDEDGSFVREGVGSGHDRVAAAVASDGEVALVFVPSRRTMTVDLGWSRAPARATWIDPTNGDERPGPDGLVGRAVLNTPGANAAGGPDWLLAVRP